MFNLYYFSILILNTFPIFLRLDDFFLTAGGGQWSSTLYRRSFEVWCQAGRTGWVGNPLELTKLIIWISNCRIYKYFFFCLLSKVLSFPTRWLLASGRCCKSDSQQETFLPDCPQRPGIRGELRRDIPFQVLINTGQLWTFLWLNERHYYLSVMFHKMSGSLVVLYVL